jgi:uncharacterized protein
MPLSRYLKIYPCQDQPGFHLLYSTKKGSLLRVSTTMLTSIKEDTLADSDRATLTRLEMICADPVAELASMGGLVERSNLRRKRFQATVVLTLDCNLACPYCFEGNFRGNYAMSGETSDSLIAWVEREQIVSGRDVALRFYGGEPLLALERLKEIACRVQSAAREGGVNFSCSMVSNGTLLTRRVVEELLPLGLESAQLTLDGPAEMHDRLRPYVSGHGSFATILTNIKETYDLISLKLGGNFTIENYLKYPQMLDALLEAGIDPAKLAPVQFAPILPKSGRSAGHDDPGNCFSSSEPWLIEASLYLRQETLKRGFAVLKPSMGICTVEVENDLVINYDGSLYKCPAFMGWPELSVGSLADGVRDYSASHNLAVWHNDECLACAYLPLCFGGCRLNLLLKNGVINEVDCRREFYDAALEQFILQDLRQNLPNNPY